MALRRNRDFVLLQAGQLLSSTGSAFSSVAYPLLVLALTHSPAKAGLVSFARLLPVPTLALLAGAAGGCLPAAAGLSRPPPPAPPAAGAPPPQQKKPQLLAADAARALALGSLAV